ncbi:MAG: hypothetical protein QM703_27025 [Gemmatales bacterium]
MSSDKQALMKSALRKSRKDSSWVGHWLYQQRRREKLKVKEQARQLDISISQLVSLSLCMTPRQEHFQDDLMAISQHCKVTPTLLAGLLRKEWALAQWQGQAKPQANQSGWLMAASETPLLSDEDDEKP